MVSKKVKLRVQFLKDKEKYRKGILTKSEFNELKNTYESQKTAIENRQLYELATAPREKVIGSGQEAARQTLMQRQSIQQPSQEITQVTNQYGQTYKGKVVGDTFIGVRPVSKREQQLKASTRAGFYSFYPLQASQKTQASIIAEQTAIRGSLGIYTPTPFSTDVKYTFEKPKTEIQNIKEESFGKKFYSNIITSTDKASMKFKYAGYKKAFILSEVSGGAVSTFVYPFTNSKEFAIGIAKLGLPIYYPEIAKGVYTEIKTRPYRFAGSLVGSYAFNEAVVKPSIQTGYSVATKSSSYYNYVLKPGATNLIPEKIRFGGYTKRQYYQLKTELANANNLYDLESRTPFRIGRNLYVPDKSLGNVPDFKIRDMLRPSKTIAQPKQNIYVGISRKTRQPVTIGIEEGIRTGKLIEVRQGTRVMIVPFNLGFGRQVLEFEQQITTTPKDTFTYGKNVFNYPTFKQTPVKMYTENVGAVFNTGSFSTTVKLPNYYYLPKYESVQNIKSLNIQTSITKQKQELTPKLRNDFKYDISQRRVQAQTPVQIPIFKQKQKSELVIIQKPIQQLKSQSFKMTGITITNNITPRTPKTPTFFNYFPKSSKKQPKSLFSKGLSLKQPKAYLPSLRASFFGLKGKKDDYLTGLEERLL
jgi:hypothetical protein